MCPHVTRTLISSPVITGPSADVFEKPARGGVTHQDPSHNQDMETPSAERSGAASVKDALDGRVAAVLIGATLFL